MYEVIDYASNESHGSFDTLDEARGCVDYDRLLTWGIFDESGRVEESEDVVDGRGHWMGMGLERLALA